MSRHVAFVVALVSALAGCTGGEDPAGGPNPGTNSTNGTGNGTTNGTGQTASLQWRNHPGDADGPASTAAGALASFTWSVVGPSNLAIAATKICWDDASHASVAPSAVETAYNQQCADAFRGASGYAPGSDLNRQVIAPTPGTWFARAWARAGGLDLASSEIQWTIVEPGTTTVTVPKAAPAVDGSVAVAWRVNGPPADVSETGVAWGPDHVGDNGTGPSDPSAYTGKTTVDPAEAPATFMAEIPVDGVTYYRAYAVVNGETYWSREHVA